MEGRFLSLSFLIHRMQKMKYVRKPCFVYINIKVILQLWNVASGRSDDGDRKETSD